MRHALAFAFCLGFATCVAADTDDRVIEGSAAAGDALRFELDGGVGEMRIEVGADDKVRWRVALEADPDGRDFFGGKRRLGEVRADLEKVKVEHGQRGTTFKLTLVPPAGLDDDDFQQRWTISLPKRFAAEVGIDVGELTVRGIVGGVEAEVDVGDIEIDVPSGAIDANVDVGDIELRLGSGGEGEIDLDADVGDVDLELAGRRIKSEGGYGPGESLRLSGKGGAKVKLHTDVGDIEAIIGR